MTTGTTTTIGSAPPAPTAAPVAAANSSSNPADRPRASNGAYVSRQPPRADDERRHPPQPALAGRALRPTTAS